MERSTESRISLQRSVVRTSPSPTSTLSPRVLCLAVVGFGLGVISFQSFGLEGDAPQPLPSASEARVRTERDEPRRGAAVAVREGDRPGRTAVPQDRATEAPLAMERGLGERAGAAGSSCELEKGVWYSGPRSERPLRDVKTGRVQDCVQLCLEVSLCAYFNFRHADRRCHLFSARGQRHEETGYTAGDCFDLPGAGEEGTALQGEWDGTAQERIHVSVSVACTAFYLWQAQALLYTLSQVGHSGGATVIVVGCDEHVQNKENVHVAPTHQSEQDKRIPPVKWRRLVGPQGWRLHFVPSAVEAQSFPWYNKPWSFAHWRKHAAHPVKEPVIAVMDPDEFFLAPLREPGFGSPSITSVAGLNGTVAPGRAVAQQYGLGGSWINMFAKDTCPKGSPCLKVSTTEAAKRYSVGPPMLIHTQDTKPVFDDWLNFMKPVLKHPKGKDILADMWAYSMSAAHNGVTHDRYDHFMVSNAYAHGEGYPWVETMEGMPCKAPLEWLRRMEKVPTVAHITSHPKAGIPPLTGKDYRIPELYSLYEHPVKGGELWNFHKGHVPPDFLSCDEPLLVSPPDDLFIRQNSAHGKREAFSVCLGIAIVNAASRAHKRKNCDQARVNFKECTRLAVIHEQARHRRPSGAPAYPLAYRVC
eukprot:Hpha_TRINITY_DN15502_c0_g4::TRINITY_DN15502_c0_g4_i7::g.104998::m.104998/K20781/SGT1; peptidyl serine alpha-galactosyltransferase